MVNWGEVSWVPGHGWNDTSTQRGRSAPTVLVHPSGARRSSPCQWVRSICALCRTLNARGHGISLASGAVSLTAAAVGETPCSVRFFINFSVISRPAKRRMARGRAKPSQMNTVCDMLSESITVSVVRPEAYRHRKVWIAMYMAST